MVPTNYEPDDATTKFDVPDVGTQCPPTDQAQSFEKLCEVFRPVLRSVVEARIDAGLLQRIDASDVVQETLLEAFTRLQDFHAREPMPIENWLRETAIQQLRVAMRKHVLAGKRSIFREVSYEQSSVYRLAEQLTAVVSTAENRYQETEEAAQTRAALLKLVPLDREILLLRYINGLTNTEAAKFLGVSETVASKRHCRALVRLQKLLPGE